MGYNLRLPACLAAAIFILCHCSDSPSVGVIPEAVDIPSNNIRHYLTTTAGDITKGSLEEYTSADVWEKNKPLKYQQFIEMVSLADLPMNTERAAPKVTVTGSIQQDGYRIDKLYYESLPGLYVAANLYVPDNIESPTAAIVYVCGHTQTQKVSYQAHPRKFAQLGFVCLIPETIQYGEVKGEHWGCYANGWFNWYSRGYTPAGVEVWNAVRGLDLLSAMPEVDTARMGTTGISGGGAISWFLGAVDSRIKAVAPVCGISTIDGHVTTRTIDGHCDCMMCINTYGWDTKDIGALIAPRPLLIAQSDRDGLNQIESAQEIYHDLKSFYQMLGHPENISFIETPGGHSYHKNSREGIFSFFLKHLKEVEVSPEKAGDIDEAALLSVDDLAAYEDGPPPDDITTTIQDSFVDLASPPRISNVDQLIKFRDQVRESLMKRTFNHFPDSDCALNPEQIFRTDDSAEFGGEKYYINTEKGWRLKANIYWRQPKDQKKPMMIILRNPNEAKNESERFSNGLSDLWNIAIVDVRGVGESGWSADLQWHIRRASAWTGRTIASMRVYDLLRFMDFIRTLPGVDSARIGVAGRGEMSVVAMYGALLDGNCKTVIIQEPPETQNAASNSDGRGDAIEMLNCLRITDVNQLPGLIYPTETLVSGEIPNSYQWSLDVAESIGHKEMIREIKLE